MTGRPSLMILLLAGVGVVAASQNPPPPTSDVPPAAMAWLVRARASLSAGTDVSRVVGLHVVGARTRSLDTRPTVDPYEFKLLLPGRFQWRAGDVLHTFADGAFRQNIPADERIREIAARQHRYRLIDTCLTFLARVPPDMATTIEDRGIQGFDGVKGRCLSIFYAPERIRVEFLLDETTGQPLATVAHGRTYGTDGSSTPNDAVALFRDYREVAGIRFPHRIEERRRSDRALIAVSGIAVNTMTPGDFWREAAAPGR